MKRFSRKQIIIGSAVLVLGLSGTGAAFFMGNDQPVKTPSKTLTTTKEQPISTETSTVNAEDPAVQTTPVAQPTPTVSTPPAPVSTSPTVSDKSSSMTAAGISADDQVWADKVVNKLSGWSYTEDGAKTLCAAIPASKMARFGADYLTNPVTQLKYCNWLAVAQYGNWQTWAKSLSLS